MNLAKLKAKIKENSLIKDVAVFLDSKNEIHMASIRIIPNVIIEVVSYNDKFERTGYMTVCFNENNRFFLSGVYCYDEYRGRNVAGNLSKIMDYMLRDYPGYIIRGVYNPTQMSTDRLNHIERPKEELEKRADNFYASAGYTKIYYKDYKANPDKYPDIDEYDEFQRGEGLAKCIIVKKIAPRKKGEQDEFTQIGDVLISRNAMPYVKERSIKTPEGEDR